ncbi:hypothetical protein F5Y16DRAFT_289627 [Xylariaceae sp. FL0255]|nr:hypothetical protein F5Y16DRAFT_289627 [Xylariaceae sp. FL0255]
MGETASFRFIELNSQIETLLMKWPYEVPFLMHSLHSICSYKNLQKLSIHWYETTIPEEGLAVLSKLGQVELLRLGAGRACGYPHDWFADHDMMMTYLGRLPKLRRLIIMRDTYEATDNEPMPSNRDRYYDFRRQVLFLGKCTKPECSSLLLHT